MEQYTQEYVTKDEHIDVQQIMDGLYYPFYMEDCRHKFIKETIGFDIEEMAQKGINLVLSGYSIKFLRSLKKGDRFSVTCRLLKDKSGLPKFHLHQTIVMNNKVYTEAIFTGTCIELGRSRPFLPDVITTQLEKAPLLEDKDLIKT